MVGKVLEEFHPESSSLASSVFFLLSMVKEDELKLKEEGQRGSKRMILEDTYSTKKTPNPHKKNPQNQESLLANKNPDSTKWT